VSWLAAVALLCFAANSVLARLALRAEQIDAASFTAIRLASGAIALWLLLRARGAAIADGFRTLDRRPAALSTRPFSFAYLGSRPAPAPCSVRRVQLTMIGAGIQAGERPHAREWIGLGVALAGLLYLNLRLSAPARWARRSGDCRRRLGCYSLREEARSRHSDRPSKASYLPRPWDWPLLQSAPRARTSAASASRVQLPRGARLGWGYAAWYAVLPRLALRGPAPFSSRCRPSRRSPESCCSTSACRSASWFPQSRSSASRTRDLGSRSSR
jgi:hypothetical protein